MTLSTPRLSHLLLVGLLTLGLVLAGCGDDDPVSPDPDPDPDPDPPEVTTIADLVADDDDFSELLGLLQEEGLDDALSDEDATFTVFAPTNDAFAPYVDLTGEDALGDILRYHVIEDDELASADLQDGEAVETLAGDELEIFVENGDVFADGSQVVNADIEAENGVVHAIDRALIGNQDLVNLAQLVTETQSLAQQVGDAGLGDALADAENRTVFGPTNAAFDEADLDGFSPEEIAGILTYHVVTEEELQRIRSSELLELLDEEGELELDTFQGEPLTVTQTDDGIVFNDGQATLTDNLDFFAAENNIAHLIDGVLVPPSFVEDDDVQDIADVKEQARAEGGGEVTATVQGTVTRALGIETRIQDETGGLMIRQTEGEFFQDVQDGEIAPGDEIEMTGTISFFSGLTQINEPEDLDDFERLSRENPLPESFDVTLADILDDPQFYKSRLVSVEDLTVTGIDDNGDVAEPGDTFEAATTYFIEDNSGGGGDTDSQEVITLRVPNEGETDIVGTEIPDEFDFEGVTTQFNIFGDPTDDQGYQLLVVEEGDIIE